MNKPHSVPSAGPSPLRPDAYLPRRRFLSGIATSAATITLARPEWVRSAEANSRIDIGIIGCGGRGQWIAKLFGADGRFNLVSAADYFQDRVDAVQAEFGLPAGRCFTGLNGYRRLLEQKLDAVVIETPPFFHPEHAAAAVDAGRHVYLAKPIAVDVPGCRQVEESARRAGGKGLCFLVDFQTRAGATFQEAVRRVQSGMIGEILYADAGYQCGPTFDAMDEMLRRDPENPEVRLRAWGLSRALSGDVITEQNIHALDLASWFLDADPLKAYGTGGHRRHFLGDCWDHFGVVFQFPRGVFVNFSSKQAGCRYDDIFTRVYGLNGVADAHYFGDVSVKAAEEIYNGGRIPNLYTEAVKTNIATFAESIARRDASNPTVAPSVRSNLTTILGRTAAYRNAEVTWEEMMKAGEKLEYDLQGLKT